MVKGNGNTPEGQGSVLAALECSGGERSEPERNGGAANTAVEHHAGNGRVAPDPEVLEKPKRRRFSAEYKARIVREADSCTAPGQIGALLRREGLYSSQLVTWRKVYRHGVQSALTDNKRGRKQRISPIERENEHLRTKVACLERRLQQTEAIIEIQKKISAMAEIPLKSIESEESD